MSIVVKCNRCEQTFKASDDFAGKRGRCPKCKNIIVVPARKSPATNTEPPGPAAVTGAQQNDRRAQPAAHPARQTQTGAAQETVSQQVTPRSKQPPSSQPAPKRKSREELQQEILGAFQGQIQPVAVAGSYRFGIAAVSIVMIMLPLLYLALVACIGYGVYYHAVNYTEILTASESGRGGFFALIVYIAPMVIGPILIIFMLKPLFSRRIGDQSCRILDQAQEPLLFALVERICEAVGSPKPTRIEVDCDVNASARFRRGLVSFARGDLVLRIGLPLVAGLSLNQLAGVLAHEFGHFSQGAGMRLTYIIRSISHWLTRAVYERDRWDEQLVHHSKNIDLRIGWILWAAMILIWLTRKVLWVLMMVGHFVGGFMLREMEFDADLYETRLVGPDTFESTARRLMVLNVASQGAYNDLDEYFREGRLGDDLPRLIMANVKQLDADALAKIDKLVDDSTTGLFDTHPCETERIENAREDQSTGIFHVDYPATVMFRDFPAESKRTTLAFYRNIFGNQLEKQNLHPVEDLVARQEKEQDAFKATSRFTQDTLTTLRPLKLPTWHVEPPKKPREAAARLKRLRQDLIETGKAYRDLLESMNECFTQIVEAEQARALFEAGFKVRKKTFRVAMTSKTEAMKVRGRAATEIEKLGDRMTSFEERLGARLLTGLQFLHVPKVAERIDSVLPMQRQCEDLLPVLRIVGDQIPALIQLRYAHAGLAILVNNLEGNEQNEDLITSIRWKMRDVLTPMTDIRQTLYVMQYPFDHAQDQITVGEYVLPDLPTREDLGGIYEGAGMMTERMSSLYVRMAARLIGIAEQVESAIGFAQLPAPPRTEQAESTEPARA